jgi:hypothetical protein
VKEANAATSVFFVTTTATNSPTLTSLVPNFIYITYLYLPSGLSILAKYPGS